MGPKMIALLNAKAGMDRDAFIRRYEEGHAPLVSRLIPFFTDYRRSFVRPGSAASPANPDEPNATFGCDVITELWFSDQAALAKLFETVGTTEAGKLIDEDETHFFDRSRLMAVFADEYRTPAEQLAPRPAGHSGRPAVKMYIALNRRDGMSPEDFKDYYEGVHSKLALRILAQGGKTLFAEYARNYPKRGETVAIGERSGPLREPFDVLTEICLWTEEDARVFAEMSAQGEVAAMLREDEAKFLDMRSPRMVFVDEYVSS